MTRVEALIVAKVLSLTRNERKVFPDTLYEGVKFLNKNKRNRKLTSGQKALIAVCARELITHFGNKKCQKQLTSN